METGGGEGRRRTNQTAYSRFFSINQNKGTKKQTSPTWPKKTSNIQLRIYSFIYSYLQSPKFCISWCHFVRNGIQPEGP